MRTSRIFLRLKMASSTNFVNRSSSRSQRTLGGLRPHHALVLFRNRREALVDKLLHTLSPVRLRGEHVALRIGSDAVNRVELPRLPAAVPKAGQHFKRFAVEDVYLLVRSVGEKNELLSGVFRESDIPDRSVAQRVLVEDLLLDEGDRKRTRL